MVEALTPAEMGRNSPPTFSEVLDRWARQCPDRRAYAFLGDGEHEEASLTFGELRSAALAVAEKLAAISAPGDRAILFYPSGLDFIVAFLGCLCAGVVAVPVSVPNRKRGVEIVSRICRDSGARWILSERSQLARYEGDLARDPVLGGVKRIDTGPWSVPPSGMLASIAPAPLSAPALLQYTSGSTGAPRGVVVTHANLAHNHREMQRCFRHDESAVIVSWLPMFHDMGLGSVFQALWIGAQCLLMSPSAFLQKPARWLQAITRYRGTSSGGPDFAFDLCARRVSPEERAGLDLSSWKVACNGSEPVRAATLASFQREFSRVGFRWEAFQPVYGLAEATLLAAGGSMEHAAEVGHFSRHGLESGVARLDNSEQAQPLVSCGKPWPDGRLLIVDPASGATRAAGEIGEIWLSGPSVAAGYWGKEAETEETFRAYTPSGEGPFLRTGDLGFEHGGNLYVTGRLKDVIIVRGRNHYPQDIEDTVGECHPMLEPQRCAAFSVEAEDGESLVIVQEVKRTALRNLDSEDVFRAIRHAVADRHGLYAASIVLLRPLALLRTTSGKVRRKACRDAFLRGGLDAVASSGLAGSKLTPNLPSNTPPPPSPARERLDADGLVQWLRQYSWASERGERGRSLGPDVMAEFGRRGLWGMQVGSGYGGLALGHRDTALVLEQLGGVDLGTSLFVGLNNYLGVWPILRHGHLKLQQAILPQLARGQVQVGFGLTEPGDPKPEAWESHAEAVNGSGWRLHGRKYLNGNLRFGLVNAFVRHRDRPGVSAFVVPQSGSGSESSAQISEHGVLRDTLQLDGIFVEPHQLLGRLGEGMAVAREAISHSHLAIGAACLGGMKRCSQLIFQYATHRQPAEPGLVAHPVTMTKLGRITAEVTALECLVRLLADAADNEDDVAAEAFTVCRLVGSEMLWQAVDDLLQLLGRRGVAESSQVRNLVDDVRVLRGLEGPTEAASARLGAGLLQGRQDVMSSLASDVFGFSSLDLVHEAAAALRAWAPLEHEASPSNLHWIQARAGELTTWLVLLGAVESKRRAARNADLDRAAVWTRSNLDRVLALTHGGPPPESQLEAQVVGGAIAAYGGSVGEVDPRRHDPLQSSRALLDARGLQSHTEPVAVPASAGASVDRNPRRWAVTWLANRLRVDESQIDPRRSFADHGVDSLVAVEFVRALADELGRPLDETLLWNFSTIDALLEHLRPGEAAPEVESAPQAGREDGTAPTDASKVEDEIALLELELKRRR
jgi:acyl-CoA synthetase (AMP-forming)/AMP-acid ligase II/alkylation response protein AidB-like acyl-CoA dehydrogenase/acyl carrier protein